MALTPINLTEAQLFMSIDQTASKFTETSLAMKAYIDNRKSVTEETLRAEIAENKVELENALQIDMDALTAFKLIVDGFDGTEDGEFDVGAKLLEYNTALVAQGNRVTVNETSITTIQNALAAEVTARTAQGTTLTEAIAEVKQDGADMFSGFETSLNALLARVDAIEAELNKVGALFVAGVNRTASAMNTAFDNAKTLFAIPTA